MGGDYYERDVIQSVNAQGWSDQANNLMVKTSLSASMDPKRVAKTNVETLEKNPIVFALDVTGSMGNWTKVCIYVYIM